MCRFFYFCSCVLFLLAGRAASAPPDPKSFDDLNGSVSWLAFAPDGKSIVFATRGGMIGLREIKPGGRNATFKGRGGFLGWRNPFLGPWSGALAADGRTLALGYGDGTVEMWDLALGARRGTIKVSETFVRDLALSPDGSLLVTLWGNISVWDSATGKYLRGHPSDDATLSGLALSPDGKRLAASTTDGPIRLWDFQTAKVLPTLQGHTHNVRSLTFAPDGKTLISGGDDGIVRIWEVATAKTQRIFPMPTGQEFEPQFGNAVWRVAVSGDGKTIAAVDRLARVRLWDSATGKDLAGLTTTTGALSCIALSHNGKQLLLGGEMGRIHFWDTATGKERATARHPFLMQGCAVSPDSKLLVAALDDMGSNRAMKVWNVETGAERIALPPASTGGPSFSPDGKTLVTGHLDGTARLWDTANFKERTRLDAHHEVLSTMFSADGKTLAVAGHDKVSCWDVTSAKQLGTIRVLAELRLIMTLTPDGKTLATCGEQQTVQIWDVATGKEKKRFDLDAELWPSLGLSAEGKALACGQDKGTITLWDTATGRLAGTLQVPGGRKIISATFSADGKSLVSHDDNGTVRHWDLATRKQQSSVGVHNGKLGAGFLTPDGKTFVTFDQVGTIQLWDVGKLTGERR